MKFLRFLAMAFFFGMVGVMLLQLFPNALPNRPGEKAAIKVNKWLTGKRNTTLRDATLHDRDNSAQRNK